MTDRIARAAYARMHAFDQGRWRLLSGWEVIGVGECVRCGARLPVGAHVTKATRAGRAGYSCPTCVPCHPVVVVRTPWKKRPLAQLTYWADRFTPGCRLCEDERAMYEAHLGALGHGRERCPQCNGTGYVPNAAK